MSELWERALQSAETARRALANGDATSAISRAYYAMFDAARAMLETIDPDLLIAKTHASIFRRFAENYVHKLNGEREQVRALRRAFKSRNETEYETARPSIELAREALRDMDQFLSALGEIRSRDKP